jgi:PAS domain S-box-containing protein
MDRRSHPDSLFRQIVEVAPDAMVMVNLSGRVELVNARFERLFGFARDEILRRSIEMVVPKWFRGGPAQPPTAFLAGPWPLPMAERRIFHAVHKDGGEFAVEIGFSRLETENGTMVLSTIVDLSDRKQKEEHIQTILKDRDILLGEIHHRFKNNLQIVYSLLELQAARVSDQAVRDLLRDSQNRIQSMALIHRTLSRPRDFETVDFGMFLNALLPALTRSHRVDPGRIAIRLDVEPVQLPIAAAMPCGLVANELIVNAFRHAFQDRDRGEVRVALARRPDNEALLSVSDDGIGLPDHVDIENTQTLGLQLVGLLVDQMDGVVSVRRSNPTAISVRFPI